MKFVFVTTILLAAMACDALRVPTSHIRNLDDADPEVPLEPVTRRMTEATFESVLADLDALILDVEELEDQSDALKADLDKCNADLQTCPGGTQPACPGFDNLIDLKDAIDDASDSTQTGIVLCPSTINLTSPIAIQSKNVTITCFDAGHSGDCIFDGEDTSGLFSVTQGSTVVFGSIKFKDGKASEGAAVYVEASTVDFVDCDFTGNHAVEHGGAVYLYELSGSATVDSCTFSNNKADETGGALLIYDSTVDIEGSTFSGNRADWGGAMSVWRFSDVDVVDVVNDSSFSMNIANDGGGAIYAKDSVLSFDNAEFIGNKADAGAGLRLSDAEVDLSDIVFSGNENTGSDTDKGVDLYIEGDSSDVVCAIEDVYFCDGIDPGIFDESGSSTINCDTESGAKCP